MARQSQNTSIALQPVRQRAALDGYRFYDNLTDDHRVRCRYRYTFQVRAVNSVGNSAASTAVTETTDAETLITAPGAPTSLSATAQTGGTSVELDWTAPSDNGGAAITDYETSSDDGTTWVSTSSTVRRIPSQDLTKERSTRSKVRAINSAGDGTASASVTETTATTVPDPPTSLDATVTRTTAALSWTAP